MTTPANQAQATELLLTGINTYVNPAMAGLPSILPHFAYLTDKACDWIGDANQIMASLLGIDPSRFTLIPSIPPTTLQGVIDLLSVGGPQYVKPAMAWFDANLPQTKISLYAHNYYDRAGYFLEEICGVPEEEFGAGGTSKGGGGSGGGGG